MSSVAARRQTPLSQLAQWLDSAWPAAAEWVNHGAVKLEDEIRDDHYVVRAELPGLDPEKDVNVAVTDGVLTINGERHQESKDKSRSEFYYGSFSRSMTLPVNVTEDDVNATYKDGILEVSFPYTTDKPEQHKIAITRS